MWVEDPPSPTEYGSFNDKPQAREAYLGDPGRWTSTEALRDGAFMENDGERALLRWMRGSFSAFRVRFLPLRLSTPLPGFRLCSPRPLSRGRSEIYLR